MDKLLVIGHLWPEPDTTAAGNRMLQLLEVFLKEGFQITFASAASKTAHSYDLGALGITEAPIFLNDDGFNSFVAELDPAVVLFDRFMTEEQFGWRVQAHCPAALRVLNTEDLHSLRGYRAECVKEGHGFEETDWRSQDKTKREIASIYRCDLSLIISSFELGLLKESVGIPGNLLMYLPFMLDPLGPKEMEDWPSFEERRDFIAFGNGRHAPNIDAFVYLKKSIWPRIRERVPKAQLHIYGAYLPQRIKDLHRPNEGFLVHGWVADLKEEVTRARVLLAPLRFGAGIKGKLALAMQCGTPNVTTAMGKEGMGANEAWPGYVEASAELFSEKAITLYSNESIWIDFQNNGFILVNKNFNFLAWQRTLMDRLNSLLKNLQSHRNKNFIGALLQHQSMAASKYMGKWITEKNAGRNMDNG